MQWSCPHCGIHLTVSEGTLGTGWSFSRCYKCGGFALIRRAEINIIKVDKAPPGERIILPESSQVTQLGLMSENATQKISKHIAPKNKSESLPSPSAQPIPLQSAKSQIMDMQIQSLPEPLPEIPAKRKKFGKIPIGMSITGIMAAVSGIYLYIQGQALWNKTHDPVSHHFDRAESRNEPKTELKSEGKPEAKVETQSPTLLSKTQEQTGQMIVDQVQRSAMAPVKMEVTETSPPIPRPSEASMLVRVRPKKANLHSGPGMQFPVIGTASQDIRYRVTDWNERWFMLHLENGTVSNQVGWIRNDLVQVIPNSAPGITTPDINPLHN